MEVEKIKLHKVLTCKDSENASEISKKLKDAKERRIFVIDGETKIKDVIKKAEKELKTSITLTGFKMLKLGDGIEVSESDFAAEVAATAGIK